LETDSAASYGVLNPPLRGIVQLANSAALRLRNWSFNNNIRLNILIVVSELLPACIIKQFAFWSLM
jgi:hypothetical protein